MAGQTNYGTGSLQNNTGNSNSAFGDYAATSNQSGICITAVGANALYNNTTGPHNTSIGAGSMFYNKTGDRNTAVGSSALEGPLAPLTTVGNQNVAIGAQALYSNYGDYNVAVGCYALIDNTSGYNNTAVGYQALYSNTDGSNNTALGYQALNKNTTGIFNVALGAGPLFNNQTGSWNIAVGDSALLSNISGNSNIALGLEALTDNNGSSNVSIGPGSMQYNTTGSSNVAIGQNSLSYNRNNVNNTAIGVSAGGTDLSGNSSNNTFLGAYSDVSSNLLAYNNSTALGYNATIDASNQIIIGGLPTGGSYPSVKIPGTYVGIGGVYNPGNGFTLDVSGNLNTTMDASINTITVGRGGGNNSFNTAVGLSALKVNTGVNNTSVGFEALKVNIGGGNNTAVGCTALTVNTAGSNNTAIGFEALLNNNGSTNTAIGSAALPGAIAGSNNTAVGMLAGHKLTGNSNSNTFIGVETDVTSNTLIYNNSTALGYQATIDASNQIYLGNISITSLKCQVALTAVSDARDKTNFEPLDAGVNFINEIKPVRFDWNQRGGGLEGRKDVGFTAQDLLEVQEKTNISIPNLVDVSNPEKYTVMNTQLLPILVKAVQELSAKVTSLETELSELKK